MIILKIMNICMINKYEKKVTGKHSNIIIRHKYIPRDNITCVCVICLKKN